MAIYTSGMMIEYVLFFQIHKMGEVIRMRIITQAIRVIGYENSKVLPRTI